MCTMKARFKVLWKKCRAKTYAERIYGDLERRYSEPHRFYHNMHHIENCLNELDLLAIPESDSILLEFALWFHDAVYNPSANDNEEKSALLAKSVCVEAELSESFCRNAEELILISKHNTEPEDNLQKLIIDLDLSILGADPSTYDIFEKNIRKEYMHVNDQDFLTGRSNILQSFLNRHCIFYTGFFYNKFEKAARSNLERTIMEYKRRIQKVN
jgi:predicted metal-dependent HD superfamily phosphohydrolase